jgi:AcrR family transcriptional regulator
MGRGEVTRNAILERATALTTQIGLGGLSIGRLAEELHLSKSGLFAHFQSKEALQLQTIEFAAERFVETVVKPALAAPRGEPRVRALFEHWLAWPKRSGLPGGCFFVGVSGELDDQPGPLRDRLRQLQKDWVDTLAHAVRIAMTEGQLRADLDPEQFAYELYGIMLVTHHFMRLLGDPSAESRARRAFDDLLKSGRRNHPVRKRSRAPTRGNRRGQTALSDQRKNQP